MHNYSVGVCVGVLGGGGAVAAAAAKRKNRKILLLTAEGEVGEVCTKGVLSSQLWRRR